MHDSPQPSCLKQLILNMSGIVHCVSRYNSVEGIETEKVNTSILDKPMQNAMLLFDIIIPILAFLLNSLRLFPHETNITAWPCIQT